MQPDTTITIQLSVADAHLLLEGLDTYEYWQFGDVLPRNHGMVFLPDDLFAERYWSADETPSEVQVEAIEAVRVCRALGDRLTRAVTVDV